MLKFSRLLAALAAVLSTQVTSNLLATPANATEQWVQGSTSKLVMTDETSNSSTDTPGIAEKIGPAGMILATATVGGCAVGAILSARKANSPLNPSSTLPHSSSKLSFKSKEKEDFIRFDRASSKLRKKLLTLLHDDQDTAIRLLSQVKINNPNRSINWYVEKVIYDLERDRGSY